MRYMKDRSVPDKNLQKYNINNTTGDIKTSSDEDL